MSPFLEPRHEELRARARDFADGLKEVEHRDDETDALCTAILRRLGEAGLAAYAVPAPWGGALAGAGGPESLDVRSLCVIREELAHRMELADFAFAMQGLGSYPVALAGTDAQRQRVLPRVARGELAAAFALTEPEAGSDAAALATTAVRDGDGWVIHGHKRFISNAPVFGMMTLFARTGDGTRGVSAFLVEPGMPGVRVVPQQPISPHPIGDVIFEGARLPEGALLGEEGRGFKIALTTLDVFRTTVGAAALGMGRRAHEEAVAHVKQRRQFGAPLAALQGVQFLLAESEVDLELARLAVEKAAWTKDGGARVTREAAIAKLVATEHAQRVIDRSLQLHGGAGVMKGSAVERLYRGIRALRIYEGATEVQKLVIARNLLEE